MYKACFWHVVYSGVSVDTSAQHRWEQTETAWEPCLHSYTACFLDFRVLCLMIRYGVMKLWAAEKIVVPLLSFAVEQLPSCWALAWAAEISHAFLLRSLLLLEHSTYLPITPANMRPPKRVSLGCSLRNISTPPKNECMELLIEKSHSFVKRMIAIRETIQLQKLGPAKPCKTSSTMTLHAPTTHHQRLQVQADKTRNLNEMSSEQYVTYSQIALSNATILLQTSDFE